IETLDHYGHVFFFNVTSPTVIYTLSLHDALPIFSGLHTDCCVRHTTADAFFRGYETIIAEDAVNSFTELQYRTGLQYLNSVNERSEEHTSELQSRGHLVCRLLLEKKKHTRTTKIV